MVILCMNFCSCAYVYKLVSFCIVGPTIRTAFFEAHLQAKFFGNLFPEKLQDFYETLLYLWYTRGVMSR